jgi:5-methylcytosine-specific restriction enzyme subunit McrC
MTPNYVSATEHELLAIGEAPGEKTLTQIEANRLMAISQQRGGFCQLGVRTVRLSQYCGIVSLGTRVLEILPKVSDYDSHETCRGVLLRLLKVAGRFPQFQHLPAGQEHRSMPLLEVFIHAYFDAVTVLSRGGLMKQYCGLEEDLNVVRGRIDLDRQMAANANRPDRVACAFDELTIDHIWHRTLKRAIRLTRPWIHNIELNRRWIELMALLDEVEDTRLRTADLDRLVFDRKAERYRTAIDWARWIIALLSPSLRAGQHEAPSLLFDMNRLFESSIAAVLRRRADYSGLVIDTQETGRHFATSFGGDRSGKVYNLRPDLMLRQGKKLLAIGDTKWKLVDREEGGRLKPSNTDLLQMFAYAAAYHCSELTLIYPWSGHLGGTVDTYLELPPVDGKSIRLDVVCVDVRSDRLPVVSGAVGSAFAEVLGSAR